MWLLRTPASQLRLVDMAHMGDQTAKKGKPAGEAARLGTHRYLLTQAWHWGTRLHALEVQLEKLQASQLPRSQHRQRKDSQLVLTLGMGEAALSATAAVTSGSQVSWLTD